MRTVAAVMVLLVAAGCGGGAERYRIKPDQQRLPGYRQLWRMDRNKDGMINRLDRGEKKTYTQYQDVLDDYVAYLNRDRQLDAAYGAYLIQDIDLDGRISPQEKQLAAARRQGDNKKFVQLLSSWGDLSPFQRARARYLNAHYQGESDRVAAALRELVKLRPSGRFAALRTLSEAGWQPLQPERSLDRYFLHHYLGRSLIPRLHNRADSLEFIRTRFASLFPVLFSDSDFMLKYVLRVQLEYEHRIVKLRRRLRSETGRAERLQISTRINAYKNEFDALDKIYAHVSQIPRLPGYTKDRVAYYQKQLRSSYGTGRPENFRAAQQLVVNYLQQNNVPRNEYHFVVGALLAEFIQNRKPYDESDLLFSPDTLFDKGYGVCTDHPPVFSMILQDLIKGFESGVYFWYRRHFFQHISMIYQNPGGRWYILDNYGINRFRFKTRIGAVKHYCRLAYRYMRAEILPRSVTRNISWAAIEFRRSNRITSSDKSLSYVFKQLQKCPD